MSYDEVEIEDMDFYDDEDGGFYTYPCPCGDYFQITREELAAGEEIAKCPSCSLYITVIYNQVMGEGNMVSLALPGCALRALWVFSSAHEVLYSRRFPVVEKQCAKMAEVGGEPHTAVPTFDRDVAVALQQAIDGHEPPAGKRAPLPAAVCLWRQRQTHLIAARSTELSSEDGEGDDRVASAKTVATYLPYLVIEAGHLRVTLLPNAPEMLCREVLAEVVGAAMVGPDVIQPQACWPSVQAISTRVTAALQLLEVLAGLLGQHPPPSHGPGFGQQQQQQQVGNRRERDVGKEVEAGVASVRAFVATSIPLGMYSGAPPLDGEYKTRVSAGKVTLDSLQAAWKPQLFTGNKQKLFISIVETVAASLPSTAEAGHPPHAGAERLQIKGTVRLAAEMKDLPEISVALASPGCPLRGVALHHCRGTEPPLRAGATEGVEAVTVVVVPPLRSVPIIQYTIPAGPPCHPPFTANYTLSCNNKEAGSLTLAFSVELIYAAPSSKAVLDTCAVYLPVAMDHTLEVVAVEGVSCTLGTAVFQDGELLWRGLGGGRLNPRTTRATASGTLLLSPRPPRNGAPGAEVLPTFSTATTTATPRVTPSDPRAPPPPSSDRSRSAAWRGIAGVSAMQVVAHRRPAYVEFSISGHTLSGARVEADKIAISPPVKELATELPLEVVARKGEYVVWSHMIDTTM